jgi:hypothetical protein
VARRSASRGAPAPPWKGRPSMTSSSTLVSSERAAAASVTRARRAWSREGARASKTAPASSPRAAHRRTLRGATGARASAPRAASRSEAVRLRRPAASSADERCTSWRGGTRHHSPPRLLRLDVGALALTAAGELPPPGRRRSGRRCTRPTRRGSRSSASRATHERMPATRRLSERVAEARGQAPPLGLGAVAGRRAVQRGVRLAVAQRTTVPRSRGARRWRWARPSR